MRKCVIFDLDGTLTNTIDDIATAMNRALKMYGLPGWETKEYCYLVGNGAKILAQRAVRDRQDLADAVQAATSLPLLHIAELTADELEAAGVSTVGLLGTRYTMEQDFYTRKLVERGITVLIPEEDGRAFVNRVIFDELCLGTVSESSRRAFAAIIGGLTARGAQGVILGCTEIGLLVRPGDTSARLFDTTEIHARRAALYALGEAVPRDGGE